VRQYLSKQNISLSVAQANYVGQLTAEDVAVGTPLSRSRQLHAASRAASGLFDGDTAGRQPSAPLRHGRTQRLCSRDKPSIVVGSLSAFRWTHRTCCSIKLATCLCVVSWSIYLFAFILVYMILACTIGRSDKWKLASPWPDRGPYMLLLQLLSCH
jgi:hypothetical protein